MSSVKVCLFVAAIFIYFSAANAYSADREPRLGRQANRDNSDEDQDDFFAQSSQQTREDGRASLAVEQAPFFGQTSNTGTDQGNTNGLYQESSELTTEEPSQIIQASQERNQQRGSSEQQFGQGQQYVDQGLLSVTTEEPAQIIQTSQERDGTEPPITNEEVQAELELVREEVREAEVAKGGPLNRDDVEKIEEDLEQKPWYQRFSTGVSKFFKGIFGGRAKRYDSAHLSF